MAFQRRNFPLMFVAILITFTVIAIVYHRLSWTDTVIVQNTTQITQNYQNIIQQSTESISSDSQNKQYLDSYLNDRDISWLELYNKTRLREDVKATFTKYSSRFDRIRPSTESFISIDNLTILFHPQFKNAKIGPLISLYWQSRMISFFSQFYKFKVVSMPNTENVSNYEMRRYKLFSDKTHYFSFLPKQSNIHCMDIDYETFSKYQDWILFWMLSTRKTKMGGLYIYGFDLMDLMESKIFTDIMRYETNMAFNEYYKMNGMIKQQNLIENEMWISKTDDVLIHIRCQDVLLNGAQFYGMSSLHYFNDAIMNIFNITLHDKMAIHIVLYLGELPGRIHVSYYEDIRYNGCIEYLYKYLQPAFIKIFDPVQIKLIVNGTVDDDFYRFIKAPNVICGASSYCLMGAIANSNNIVLYKQWTHKLWYKWKEYDSFGPIADNIYFLDDPYFVDAQISQEKGWNVDKIAHKAMVIDGKYVLL